MDWKNYLSKFQQAYKETNVSDDNNFDELPDGDYVVRVERVELKQSKTGRPMLEWEFVVYDGEFAGRHEWKYNLLDSVDRIQWLKKDLFRAGLELEDITQLETSLPQLLDRLLEIKIKSRQGNNGQIYRNVYINKEIEKTVSEKGPFTGYSDTEPLNITDDDLPF